LAGVLKSKLEDQGRRVEILDGDEVRKGLSRDLGLSMAFISHDLSVIRAVCDRVYVLQSGRIVEEGYCDRVFATPRHEYTRALLDAIPLPRIDPDWLGRTNVVEAVGERDTNLLAAGKSGFRADRIGGDSGTRPDHKNTS
jgi:ABC-type dipeptide/oligopeptide/nickel transport system ATPase component